MEAKGINIVTYEDCDSSTGVTILPLFISYYKIISFVTCLSLDTTDTVLFYKWLSLKKRNKPVQKSWRKEKFFSLKPSFDVWQKNHSKRETNK